MRVMIDQARVSCLSSSSSCVGVQSPTAAIHPNLPTVLLLLQANCPSRDTPNYTLVIGGAFSWI